METTIEVKKVFIKEAIGKNGEQYKRYSFQSKGDQYLKSDYYSTFSHKETEAQLSNILQGYKVTLDYKATKPGQNDIIRIIKVVPSGPHAPSRNQASHADERPVTSKSQSDEAAMPVPKPMTDTEVDALFDSAHAYVAWYYKMSAPDVKTDPLMIAIVGKYFDAKMAQRIQKFDAEKMAFNSKTYAPKKG